MLQARNAQSHLIRMDSSGMDEKHAAADLPSGDGGSHSPVPLIEVPPIELAFPTTVESVEGDPAWYALYTRSRFEKKLLSDLVDRSIEVFLPMREVLSRWKDRKKKVWLPLFPGYLFVHQIDSPANRYRVLNLPGAVRFIGFNGQYVPIPQDQIDGVRKFLEAKLAVDPYPYMTVGRRVEVIAGPLKGIQGKLVQKKGRFRFVIQVDLIRQAVSVEIDASDVRPL
jgi:transcription termination/antitermination protein NusG